MQIGKAPSLDGFPIEFFKTFWYILAKDLTLVVEEIKSNGRIFNTFNHTFLILIPKEGHMEHISNYRPIALCNVVYKIIAKLLANRLKKLLS